MKTRKIISVLLATVIVSLLFFQVGCKKDDDVEPDNLNVCLIGDFPNTPYFNALKAEVIVKPLNSDMPIFIHPNSIDNLTGNDIGKINMAYKKGMPITIFNPNQGDADAIVQITGHELPVVFTDSTLSNMMLLSLAVLPTQVKDYIVQDELVEPDDINNEINRFIGWIEENLTVVNNFKAGAGVNVNLASMARKYSHIQKFVLDNVTYVFTSDIQAFYSYSDSAFWVFPYITMEIDPKTLVKNSTIVTFGNVQGFSSYTYDPSVIEQAEPQTSPSTLKYTIGQSHSFTAGVSVGMMGPSVSVSATVTYSSSHSVSCPSTDIQNNTDLTNSLPAWQFTFNQEEEYAEFDMSWIWKFPYNASINDNPCWISANVYIHNIEGPSKIISPNFTFPKYVPRDPNPPHPWWEFWDWK